MIRISLNAAEQLDSCLCQSRLRAAADPAANQHLHLQSGKHACKRTVSAAVGINDFRGEDFAVLYVVNLKLPGMTEVLKDLSIFISYRNFHFCLPFLSYNK